MVEQVVVGIDVSKVKLDVAILPSGEQFTVSNDRHGVGELVRRLSPLAPSRVVLEATGKLEQLAVSELAAAGLPVVVINPAQVRHYAKARGKWAKTDPIDARLIAEFARDLEPELRPLPDAETQALAALCQRRNQLLEMEQMEKSRLQRLHGPIRRASKRCCASCAGRSSKSKSRSSTASGTHPCGRPSVNCWSPCLRSAR